MSTTNNEIFDITIRGSMMLVPYVCTPITGSAVFGIRPCNTNSSTMMKNPTATPSIAALRRKFTSGRAALLFFVIVALFGCHVSARTDRNQPHPNQGVLKGYEPGPFDIKLTKQDEKSLAAGKPVMKQTMADSSDPAAGGGAICVQDIHAPKDVVWDQILDLNAYKGKVPKVIKSKNYYEGKTKEGNNRFKTNMVIGVMPGYSVRHCCCC